MSVFSATQLIAGRDRCPRCRDGGDRLLEGGGGAACGSAETVASVTLTPGTAMTDLYPGTSGDVAVSLANGNTYQAFVGSLVLDTGRGTNGVSVDSGHSGCDPRPCRTRRSQTAGRAGSCLLARRSISISRTP